MKTTVCSERDETLAILHNSSKLRDRKTQRNSENVHKSRYTPNEQAENKTL